MLSFSLILLWSCFLTVVLLSYRPILPPTVFYPSGWLETAVFIQKEDKAPGDFGTGYFTEYGRIGPLSGEKKVGMRTR
jgi:hypothetical protein